MAEKQANKFPPHVLLFPFPLQGHITPMLQLAELLTLGGLHVTFINTLHNHNRLFANPNFTAHFRRYPAFRFESVPDGLPDDHPRSEDKRLLDIHASLTAHAKPVLKDFIRSGRRPVTCVIADGILGFVREVAEDLGIPMIYFRTVCASAVWTFFSLPDLIQANELPFQGDDMDKPISSVKGMEDFLRRSDLPSFCKVDDLSSPTLKMVLSETKHPRTIGLILNTFEDLERPILDHIRTRVPNLYHIGPFHTHLKTKLQVQSIKQYISLQEEDRSCIEWLDQQPEGSVIYVSFGSLITVTREALMEVLHGLVNSGQRFLWVIRPSSIIDEHESDQILTEIKKNITKNGFIVVWAPQNEVLSHQAVGGFLTHSGWNSMLESIVCGVPMICWPHFADQPVNGRVVEKVWMLGLNMKNSCDRVDIEKRVRDLMEVRRSEFLERAKDMAKLAKQSVSEGGSSWSNLDRLIGDISCMAALEHVLPRT